MYFLPYLCFEPSFGSAIFVFQFQILTHVKYLGNVMLHTILSLVVSKAGVKVVAISSLP